MSGQGNGNGQRTGPAALGQLLIMAVGTVAAAGAAQMPAAGNVLPGVRCMAEQTGGFHDYPDDGERYEPALFHPQSFRLETNPVFMMNLAGGERNVDLYLTMTRELPGDGTEPSIETTELECRHVLGANGADGFSCVNLPPSEMLLINVRSLRFTRTAVGGWTFAGATDARDGDSIFVEYGQCETLNPP